LKFIASALIVLISSFVSANDTSEIINNITPEKQVEKVQLDTEHDAADVSQGLDRLNELYITLKSNIEKDLELQKSLNKSTTELLDNALANENDDHSLTIRLLQQPNLYIFALPIVTIFIVLGGTYLSLRTIKIKSQESLKALEGSNVNQLTISTNNIEAERLKSREAIVSDSRQKWINSLRDELSSLISHLKQYSNSSPERKNEIFSKIWTELFRIELLLNPKEDLHNKLLKEINTAFSLCTVQEKNEEFAAHSHKVLSTSKELLKLEWERVKNFG
jgi:hypothetical protein